VDDTLRGLSQIAKYSQFRLVKLRSKYVPQPPPNTYTPRKTLITPILGLSLPILALVLIAHNKLKNSDKDSLTRHIYIHIYPIILSPIRGQSIKGLYPLKLSKPWVPPF
jgi:hypothetical protein